MLPYAGIRVQSKKAGQITMDMDFWWGGDRHTVLGIVAAGVSLPIQVGIRFILLFNNYYSVCKSFVN